MVRLQSRSNDAAEVSKLPPESPVDIVTTKGNGVGKTVPRSVVVGKSGEPIPIETGLLSVLGADERKRIRDTELSPFRMICSLRIKAPWGEFVGTGWFAGPRTVVTAGHCVFDSQQMGGWAKTIEVTPGHDGDEEPELGPYTATRFSSVDTWLESRDPDFDIGAIHLDELVGNATGWFGIGALTDGELTNSYVNVSGYPAMPGGGRQQWWAKNRVRAVTPRRIFYDVDTSGGQSGGPVYRYETEGGEPQVIGIHAYGIGGTPAAINLEVNSAPRMIPEVVEQIRAWIADDTDKDAGATASMA